MGNWPLSFDPLYHPHPSRRMTVFSRRGMVATSHPLAAQAGLHILRQGGNAIDAAIATAATLTVVEPTSNGLGGDAFAIVWVDGQMHGLNSSGPAPRGLTVDAVRAQGHTEMPAYGWLPVTVPGIPGAWAALHRRFGRLPFRQVLEPAILYAREGFPVSPVAGYFWSRAVRVYDARLPEPLRSEWFRVFAPEGRAPRPGEMWKSVDHAHTLEVIAESHAEAFYKGEIAEHIERFALETGGLIRKEDLAAFEPAWVQPLSVRYRGYDVWELPPNGQGLVALMALRILEGYDLRDREDVETVHRQVEAMKLAFADGRAHITDPRRMRVSPEALLSDEHIASRRALISHEALDPAAGPPLRGGTVYLAAADGEGNMVSYIQSNYMGFGSGVVIPGTGIALQNRGHTFSLDEQHVNVLEPGKRTYHTIIPGFLTRDGQPVGPFGVMGGFMQPQGHLQVVSNLIDFGLNPQAALDAPRWQWMEGKRLVVEPGFPIHVAQALARRGHQVEVALDGGSFGRGEIIVRSADGVLAGATEPRTDGQVAAW